MTSTYQAAWNTAKEIYYQIGYEEGYEEGYQEEAFKNYQRITEKLKSLHPDWTLDQIADYLFTTPKELSKILNAYNESSLEEKKP